jgi:hypothetical protein
MIPPAPPAFAAPSASASALATCDAHGWGLLPQGKGLTPCTSQLLLAAGPCLFVLLAGGLSFHRARRDFDFVFPPIGWRLRAKIVLSAATFALEVVLLAGMFAWPSLRAHEASRVAAASSAVRILAWGFQTCLLYALHWRALRQSFADLRTFWSLWFVFVAAAFVSESTIKSDGLTPAAYHFAMAVAAARLAASAGLAIAVLCPNDVSSMEPVRKSLSSYPFGGGGSAIYSSSSSFNQPFLGGSGSGGVGGGVGGGTGGGGGGGRRRSGLNGPGGGGQYSVVSSVSSPQIFAGGTTSHIDAGSSGFDLEGLRDMDAPLLPPNSYGSQSGITMLDTSVRANNPSVAKNNLLGKKNKKKEKKMKKTSPSKPKSRRMKSAERNVWESFIEESSSQDLPDKVGKEEASPSSASPSYGRAQDGAGPVVLDVYNTMDSSEDSDFSEDHSSMSVRGSEDVGSTGGAAAGGSTSPSALDETATSSSSSAAARVDAKLRALERSVSTMSANDLEGTLYMECPMTVSVPRWVQVETSHAEFEIAVFVSRPFLLDFLATQGLPALPPCLAGTDSAMVEYRVRKRFSELKMFEKTLRKLSGSKIAHAMPGLQSRPVPRVLSSLVEHDDDKFMEGRRRWVEVFLQCLVHSPLLRSDVVVNFLLPEIDDTVRNLNPLGEEERAAPAVEEGGEGGREGSFLVEDNEVLAGDLPGGKRPVYNIRYVESGESFYARRSMVRAEAGGITADVAIRAGVMRDGAAEQGGGGGVAASSAPASSSSSSTFASSSGGGTAPLSIHAAGDMQDEPGMMFPSPGRDGGLSGGLAALAGRMGVLARDYVVRLRSHRYAFSSTDVEGWLQHAPKHFRAGYPTSQLLLRLLDEGLLAAVPVVTASLQSDAEENIAAAEADEKKEEDTAAAATAEQQWDVEDDSDEAENEKDVAPAAAAAVAVVPPTLDPGCIADGLFRVKRPNVGLPDVRQLDPFFVQMTMVRVTSWKRVVPSKSITPTKLGVGSRAARAYVSYCVLVLTPYGHWKTQRRYSEFRVLDKALSKTFDDASASLPPFPSKKRLRADKNSDKFLNARRRRLDIYLSAVCNTFSFQTAELAGFLDPCLDEASLRGLRETARVFHESKKKKTTTMTTKQ